MINTVLEILALGAIVSALIVTRRRIRESDALIKEQATYIKQLQLSLADVMADMQRNRDILRQEREIHQEQVNALIEQIPAYRDVVPLKDTP